jgi:prolyl-tRNA synthetase
LPLNLYQIQTKFRDEIRPRFGLMRGREFIMKDAYSFDCDDAGADASYRSMYDAYRRIFSRLGLRFRAVEADSGSIGGSFSHEFMVLAETGEDTIASCTSCAFAANVERAPVAWQGTHCTQECPPAEFVATPGAHSVAQVCDFLGVQARQIIKTIIFAVDGKAVAVLARGDREINPVKLKNLLNADALDIATPDQVRAWTEAPVGFVGPQGLHAAMRIYADLELRGATDWIAGANRDGTHVRHLDLMRDATITAFADLRVIAAADPCPLCGAQIELTRGIEVGHVFKLGTKYSKALNAVILDEQGKERHIIMGCYGIGVSRILAACIEQNHDTDGIIFPPPIAPYDAALLNLDAKNAEMRAKAEELYNTLQAQGLNVLLDDREERPGVKFKDADLVGLPVQLVLGGKGFARGVIEAKDRRSGEKTELPLAAFASAFMQWREQVLQGWNGT